MKLFSLYEKVKTLLSNLFTGLTTIVKPKENIYYSHGRFFMLYHFGALEIFILMKLFSLYEKVKKLLNLINIDYYSQTYRECFKLYHFGALQIFVLIKRFSLYEKLKKLPQKFNYKIDYHSQNYKQIILKLYHFGAYFFNNC